MTEEKENTTTVKKIWKRNIDVTLGVISYFCILIAFTLLLWKIFGG